MKKHTSLKNLVLSAMFLAIGLVLPFFIGQIPAIGKMLLPMHIPVLLCGLICGAAAVGAVQLSRHVPQRHRYGLRAGRLRTGHRVSLRPQQVAVRQGPL